MITATGPISQTILIAALTLLSIVVCMPTLSLAMKCHHLAPATLGSNGLRCIQVFQFSGSSFPTVISDLQRTVTTKLYRDAGAPLTNLFLMVMKGIGSRSSWVSEQVLLGKSSLDIIIFLFLCIPSFIVYQGSSGLSTSFSIGCFWSMFQPANQPTNQPTRLLEPFFYPSSYDIPSRTFAQWAHIKNQLGPTLCSFHYSISLMSASTPIP